MQSEFLRYTNFKNFDDVCKSDKIQELLENRIMDLSDKGLKGNSIRTRLSPVELLLEKIRRILHHFFKQCQSRHMMNILYFLTILIMISSSFYPAFALDASQTCDPSILPPRWPSSHIYITDTNESLPYIPLTAHTAIFHDDDVWNVSTQSRVVHVTLTIQDRDTGKQVFNQTQSVQMKACSGPESVKWRFIPIQITNYIATVSDNRGNVDMGFNSMLDATKSQIVSSPLEQLRFGIDSHNVVCKQDLQLVIKSEDGSPACVKPDTKTQLLKIGWAVPGPKDFGYNPGRGPLTSHDPQSNGMNYHGLPRVNGVTIFYNGTTLSDNMVFYVKKGQNMTLMLDVISNSVNIPVTLYTAPHNGFTKTNGIDFKLSDTRVNTPATVMLYMSVSKDATPSTYGATVKANDTRLGSVTYLFFVTVK